MNNNPTKNLLASITSKSASELGDKLGEVALDSMINDGVLKDIPVFGTVISLMKAGNDISAYFFAKKIIRFLTELESIPELSRQEFVDKHSDEYGGFDEVGETLLMMIESSNTIDSASYLGRAFKLYILGEIDKYKFDNYVHIISNLTPYLVGQLHTYFMRGGVTGSAMEFLSNLNLITVEISYSKEGKFRVLPSLEAGAHEFGSVFYEKILKKTDYSNHEFRL